MHNSLPPTLLIIVGITGDLSRRKLLPAIERIASANQLPEKFKIIGITRRNVKNSDIIKSLPADTSNYPHLKKNLHMHKMNLEEPEEYLSLKKTLATFETAYGAGTQLLFYLSVPPQVSRPIVQSLTDAGFGKKKNVKLLLEKPFGSDYTSAYEMAQELYRGFDEEQLFRIDHYLEKEMAQNIIVFRNGNSLFKHTWNKNFIERIEIIASEEIGIENRAVFYEQTGTLRDVVQNHLLQLAALTLMELPEHNNWQDVPTLRLHALQHLFVPAEDVAKHALRAQYKGYREEVKNPGSQTETFAAITLFSQSEQWQGVPITIIGGKALREKTSEIRIYYRKKHAQEANTLTLRLQPREGLEIDLWSKRPGYDRELIPVQLTYHYHEQAGYLPEAYEQVLIDAMRGDNALFTAGDEVLAAWKILEPVQYAWAMESIELPTYPIGSSFEDALTVKS